MHVASYGCGTATHEKSFLGLITGWLQTPLKKRIFTEKNQFFYFRWPFFLQFFIPMEISLNKIGSASNSASNKMSPMKIGPLFENSIPSTGHTLFLLQNLPPFLQNESSVHDRLHVTRQVLIEAMFQLRSLRNCSRLSYWKFCDWKNQYFSIS